MSDGWLKCSVTEGMFSDESAVTYSVGAGQREYSFFVPKSKVRENGFPAVRVSVVRNGQQTLAIFPNDLRSAVPVRESDLSNQ